MINSCCGDPSIVIQQHCFFCEDEQIEILLINACKEKTIEDANSVAEQKHTDSGNQMKFLKSKP
jgi:hypothetical protein